jgi:hypothetical protein
MRAKKRMTLTPKGWLLIRSREKRDLEGYTEKKGSTRGFSGCVISLEVVGYRRTRPFTASSPAVPC